MNHCSPIITQGHSSSLQNKTNVIKKNNLDILIYSFIYNI